VIYTKKNFFLLDAMNEKIEQLKAAGLIEFWLFQEIDKNIINVKEAVQPKVLSLQHLSGCFQILLFGLVFSAVVFMIELLVINRTVTFQLFFNGF
jgi:hypothetical protein